MSEPSHQLPRFVTHLVGWYAITVLGLAQRSGLLGALTAESGTVEELSRRAGTDPRNTLECLRTLTASGLVSCSEETFALDDEFVMVLSAAFPVDARAAVEFCSGTADVQAAVLDAMSTGKGVPPQLFQNAFGDAVGRINAPTYSAALVSDWIGGTPGLREVLESGGRVVDIACGNGAALALVAAAFPAAEVIGYDLDPRHAEAVDGPANLSIKTSDVRELPKAETFDLALCLDSFHHLGDPVGAARSFHGVLKPGGTVLVAESDLTGDLSADAVGPFATIGFGAALLYCLQENLAAEGPGVSAGDGGDWLVNALETGGFHDVANRTTASGYRVTTATA